MGQGQEIAVSGPGPGFPALLSRENMKETQAWGEDGHFSC